MEGIPPRQLRPVPDMLWSVADGERGFSFCDELLSFLFFCSYNTRQNKHTRTQARLTHGDCDRKRQPGSAYVYRDVRGFSTVSCSCFSAVDKFSFTIHSAVHDIYSKHGLLHELSCLNTLCLQNYFQRNDTVCRSSA